MSSLWKKWRGGSGEGTSTHPSNSLQHPTTSFQGPDPPAENVKPPVSYLITSADEELFMGNFEKERPDPLLVQSQFVKTVDDILNSPATLPYFLQFLQAWNAERYARFWIDANSFRAAAMTQSCSHKVPPQESSLYPLPGDNSYSDRKVLNVVKPESLVRCESNRQDLGPSRDKGLILPDLVSNIQHASDVTPLNSPGGTSPSALTCYTQTANVDGEAAIQSKDSEGSNCITQWPKTPIKETNCTTEQCHQELQATNTENFKLEANQCSENISASKTSTLRPPDTQKILIADDALRIYNKYLASGAEMLIPLEEEELESLKAKIMVPERNVDLDCFVSLQKRMRDTLQKEFVSKFLESDYYLKHQIDVLTSGCVRLPDIIYSDSAFPYFTEYVEQEGGQGILKVWVAVSNFRQQLIEAEGGYDEGHAQADAMIIYDKYFSLQATCPQGFSDAVRFIVEGNICREGGPLPSCFDLPLRVVLHVLERDFLSGYLSSNLHIKYLSELINTVKTSIELLGRKKRSGSESTCSSEKSGSVSGASVITQNTLLAEDTRRLRGLTDSSLTMRIDESQLMDPESLWRRNNYSRLSCGFINELGRFESELQMYPEIRSESRLRKLRRFVLREEDKVREDLAYRMAEMVIRDVTSVTLQQDTSPPD